MDVFEIDHVVLDVPATSQREALEAVAEAAVNLGHADDVDDVVAGLLAREAEVSTALMDGIAIPHAKRSSIQSTALIVVRFTEPVDWAGDPVRTAVAMLVPETQAGTEHLRLLAQVSRALIDEGVRHALTTAPSSAEVFEALASKLEA